MGKLVRHVIIRCFSLLNIVAFSGCSMAYQQALAVIRQPGEHIRTAPDQVWIEYNCAERERPFVRVESMELLPERVNAGGRLNYRLIYAMCPSKPSEVVKTRAFRRLLFKGQQVAGSVNETLELKPGRWVIDSFFTLPKDSPLGVYALEVSFERLEREEQKQVRSFIVTDEFLF